jgi:signal transduction histidine kinase
VTDADRLAQVFINLISNAQKYCDAEAPEPAASEVTAVARAVVEVDLHRQRAAGIPPRQQALIFEKFARADSAKGAPGAGLGLAISREIMARLGGDLVLRARSDKGARFRVRLPVRALKRGLTGS